LTLDFILVMAIKGAGLAVDRVVLAGREHLFDGALATLKASSVQVKILTGDNDIVTRKICHEVGLPVDRIVLGREIATLSPDKFASLAETATVFAKVSPSQKAAIIDALHRKGHVVGFLGDGINDGPALKAADVGISVDSAVDIAKDSADIILLEKSLAVLGDGVIEGRKVFGNITKYIKMGASSNFGNMFSVLGASVFLPFLPMTAIQVLTNNLLYNFSQTTIPTDNVDAEYLAVPRRWDIGKITKFVLVIGPIGSIFDYVTYFTMLYGFNAWNNPALFQTGWFVESLLPDAHHPYHPRGKDSGSWKAGPALPSSRQPSSSPQSV
jgi:Mg2+-importing ATPase